MSALEHSARQIIPADQAVTTGPLRFTRRQWDQSRQVREVLDSFNHPLVILKTPVVSDDEQHTCSVVMSGTDVQITMRHATGAHVSRRFTSQVGGDRDTPLALAEVQEPFATVADGGIRGAAAEALARINTRQHRIARVQIASPRGYASSGFPWVAGVMVVAALGVAALAAWGKL